MGATVANIGVDEAWHAGEDRQLNIDVTNAADSAQDMSGWSLTWVLRSKATDEDLVTKTVGSGISITNGDGTNDRAEVTVAAADTADLAAGLYHHHLRRTDSGNTIILAYGDVTLLAGGDL